MAVPDLGLGGPGSDFFKGPFLQNKPKTPSIEKFSFMKISENFSKL